MTNTKIGIIEQARAAVVAKDTAAKEKLTKKINSKAYRFASDKTQRKVHRLLAKIN